MNFLGKIKEYKNSYNVSIILNIVLVVFVIYFIFSSNKVVSNDTKFLRENNSGYKFTSPILSYEDIAPNASTLVGFSKTNNFIDDLVKKYNVQTASVYYQDLNNGPWYGYNSKEMFVPASLVKIPIVISLFKYMEKNPLALYKKVKVTQEDLNQALKQNITDKKNVKLGQEYSPIELVNYVLEDSDNIALNVLLNNFPEDKYLDETFKQIGVDTAVKDNQLVLKNRDYATFFNVLYNASYLSKDNSELILKILSQSTFKDGIVAGVPKGIIVAHKFGERNFADKGLVLDSFVPDGVTDETKQLHDCGIVYLPGKPYILCIMTRGADLKNQESFISSLSRYIYNDVKN